MIAAPTPVSNLSANLASALVCAAASVARVARATGGMALDQAIEIEAQGLGVPERAAAQDIAYTACRRLNLLDALAARLMKKPNPAVDFLVRVALSELIDHASARAHVIVDQAVNAAATMANGAFKGLVNGVLRSFLREQDALLSSLRNDENLRLGYPAWWIERVRQAWPAQWEEVLERGNQPPAMTLRVNLRRSSVEDYQARLTAAGMAARRTGPAALLLERPVPVARLPGFAEGLVSVQDLGAQWAGYFLAGQVHSQTVPAELMPGWPSDSTHNIENPLRVLDACAAPGGKTAHLLELLHADVLALDRDAARLSAVRTNLARLGLQAQCCAADAAAIDTWWDGVPFDLVLLDVPCTASGVVSRHPDGKWLKRPGDMAALARQQKRLLGAAWQVLKPGGTLLYATCSLFPEENTRQVDAWVSTHPEARHLALAPGHADSDPYADPHADALGWRDGQLLPGLLHDGFYYALLRKEAGA